MKYTSAKNPADYFSKTKKLFETKNEEKAAKEVLPDIKKEAVTSFEKEVELATRVFITHTLHRLAVDYAARHHADGVTVTDLVKRGVAEIKKEVEASK